MKEYLQTTDAVLDKVGSSGTGLTGAEAAARLEKNGKNKLAAPICRTMLLPSAA